MTIFTCYYRDISGKKLSAEITADSRIDALHMAGSNGLNVIEIVPARSSETEKTEKTIKRHTFKNKKNRFSNEELAERKLFNQREHSYTCGYVFGPIGFIIATLIWKPAV